MTFKELVYEYGREGSTDAMEKLTCKVDWFTEKVRETNPELVDKFLMKVDLLLNPHFTRKTAEYVVSRLPVLCLMGYMKLTGITSLI